MFHVEKFLEHHKNPVAFFNSKLDFQNTKKRMELNGKYEKKQDPFKYRRAMRDIMLDIEKTENDRRDKHLLSQVYNFLLIFKSMTHRLSFYKPKKSYNRGLNHGTKVNHTTSISSVSRFFNLMP